MKHMKMFVLLLAVLLLGFLSLPDRSQALLDSHDCSFCHDLHGGPGYSTLLTAENSELVCLTCHAVSINSTDAAEVHNPLNLNSDQLGYITCRECHDAHSNRGSNVNLVGYKKDAQNWGASFTPPGIRKELPSTTGLTYEVVTYTGPTDFHIAGPDIGPCEVCHSAYHNAGQDCTKCHAHSNGIDNDTIYAFPLPDCRSNGCHDGTKETYEAERVSVDSPHSTNTIFASKGVTYTCENCHTGHGKGTVEVPNNSSVGINYSANGESGISLGSITVTGNTEAEICWGCHTADESEWNASPYNLNNGSGTAVENWTSSGAEFSTDSSTLIPDRSVRSIHTANTLKTGISSVDEYLNHADRKNLEPVADIRCSYCHDVHELALAAGDTASGAPYLRGSWMSNPYPFDQPPDGNVSNTTYYTGNSWSATDDDYLRPRLFATSTGSAKAGGYFIDQNSDWPTIKSGSTFYAVDETAGLCLLCHGTGPTLADKVNSMDKYPGTSLWAGTASNANGHANAVLSGGGVVANVASNIFDARRDSSTDNWNIYPQMAAQKAADLKINRPTQEDDDWGSGDNNVGVDDMPWGGGGGYDEPGNDDNSGLPQSNAGWFGGVSGSTSAMGDQFSTWYSATGVGTAGTYTIASTSVTSPRAHNFTCSKCHSPHASGLPALLETNCLDVALSTWDKTRNSISFGANATSQAGQRLAMNCHRKDATGNTALRSDGWNTLEAGLDKP